MQQSFEEEMTEREEEEEQADQKERCVIEVEKSKLDSCDLICHHFNKVGKTASKKRIMEVLEDLEISIPKEERGTRSHPNNHHTSGDIFLDNAVLVLTTLCELFAIELKSDVGKGEVICEGKVYQFLLKSADIESILKDLEFNEKNPKIASIKEVEGAIHDRIMQNYVISSPIAQNNLEFNQAVDVIGRCVRWNTTINNYAISEHLLSEEDAKINCANYVDYLRKGVAISYNPGGLFVIEERLNRIVSEFPFLYPHELARRERNANRPEDAKTSHTDLMENMSLEEHCPIHFEIILLTAGSYCDAKIPIIKGGNPEVDQKFKYSLHADVETVHDIIESIRKTMQENIATECNFYKQTGRGYLPLTIKGFTIRFSTFPLPEVTSSYL